MSKKSWRQEFPWGALFLALPARALAEESTGEAAVHALLGVAVTGIVFLLVYGRRLRYRAERREEG